MPPRRAPRAIDVDGLAVRWTATSRLITARCGERPGAIVREELLTPGEVVTAGRVARLVRYARSRGWDPAAPDGGFRLARESVWDDPRDRGGYRWLRLLAVQLGQLERDLGSRVELGSMHWHGGHDDASGGCGARIRFARTAALPSADHWEGVLCIDGNRGEAAYADLFAFPFRAGVSLGLADERVWIFTLDRADNLAESRWRSRGWSCWDGPGEWSYVDAPGKLFRTLPAPVRDGERWIVRWPYELEGNAGPRWSLHPIGGWFDWADAAPSRVDRDADGWAVQLELGHAPPGLRIALRLSHDAPDGDGSAVITAPFEP